MSPRRALWVVAGSQLLALTLWFSASAVAPQLQQVWRLSEGGVAWLTLTVQIGFVAGAFGSAVLNLADVIPTRRLFVLSALVGATANLGLLTVDASRVWIAFLLRAITGIALAGVYPSGLKIMAGWFDRGRGMALGVLVGALTIGSAGPHLIRGLGLDWRGVVLAASALTATSAALMAATVRDGPFEVAPQPFSWNQVGRVVANHGYRLSTYGYLGHMWELYAMWTWMAAFLAASAEAASDAYPSVSIMTFSVIAVGGIGAALAGLWADRVGRTRVAGGSMVISGACALATPVLFGASWSIVFPIVLIWGATVVSDSAQFSAMATETSAPEVRGTALTLQTAAGFLLTLITIRGVPLLAEALTWRWAFPVLAAGPAFGVWAMVRLRRSPAAVQLAGGRG